MARASELNVCSSCSLCDEHGELHVECKAIRIHSSGGNVVIIGAVRIWYLNDFTFKFAKCGLYNVLWPRTYVLKLGRYLTHITSTAQSATIVGTKEDTGDSYASLP